MNKIQKITAGKRDFFAPKGRQVDDDTIAKEVAQAGSTINPSLSLMVIIALRICWQIVVLS